MRREESECSSAGTLPQGSVVEAIHVWKDRVRRSLESVRFILHYTLRA